MASGHRWSRERKGRKTERYEDLCKSSTPGYRVPAVRMPTRRCWPMDAVAGTEARQQSCSCSTRKPASQQVQATGEECVVPECLALTAARRLRAVVMGSSAGTTLSRLRSVVRELRLLFLASVKRPRTLLGNPPRDTQEALSPDPLSCPGSTVYDHRAAEHQKESPPGGFPDSHNNQNRLFLQATSPA
ncbi:hypothetical protein M011DRAFT_310144 [Sporormia fimetaria CBS 119925]|uniref:Uncharacterized protein n=1 Tax=Sporormia fimetaria CBS 119925 TaxID=1340428 RepID=A0A6A6VI48_9PLEO|nr:hypothetical protein M011DRAFT_310144 [Sporormia fimetaria CBS 119925]